MHGWSLGRWFLRVWKWNVLRVNLLLAWNSPERYDEHLLRNCQVRECESIIQRWYYIAPQRVHMQDHSYYGCTCFRDEKPTLISVSEVATLRPPNTWPSGKTQVYIPLKNTTGICKPVCCICGICGHLLNLHPKSICQQVWGEFGRYKLRSESAVHIDNWCLWMTGASSVK